MRPGRLSRARASLHRLGSRRRRSIAVALVAALVAWAAMVQVTLSVFSSVTASSGNSLTAISLDPYVPATVSASRTSGTACAVTWTASAAAGAPATLTYDVTDGASTTLATGVTGTSTSVTVPTTAVTPKVYARVGSWVSSVGTASSTPCAAVPDAPSAVTVTPGDTLLVTSWTAPSGNGSPVTGYTVTAVPVSGGAASTCTPNPATATSCAITGLTNGTQYSVTVTATNSGGTGPASTPVLATPVAGQLLDGLTSPALGAWSVRKLRTAYAGNAMQVRRASDNTTTTIGFTGSDLDTTSLSSFCAATSCYVRTWYDQSGHGYDLTQTTNAAQPRIVNAGTVETSGGRPTLVYSGAQTLANGASAVALGTSALTGNAVAYATAGSNYAGRFLGFTASGQTNDWDNASSSELMRINSSGTVNGGRNATLASVSSTTTVLADYTMIFNGTSATIYAGTTVGSSGASSGAFGATGSFHTGANTLADSNSLLTGAVSELTTFALALPTVDRISLAGNQSTYYLLPGPVSGVTATQGDTTSTVAWTAPNRPGASSITGYAVTAIPSDAGLATVTCTATAPTTTCGLSGLTNGATYSVTVKATNAVGTGSSSSPLSLVTRPALLVGANAQLWLDGGDVDGNGVLGGSAESCDTATTCTSLSNVLKRWKDKSGKAHDAVQSTGGMAGTYTPASGAVTFTGNGYYQASTVGVGPDVTSFVVGQSTTASWNSYGWLLGARAANGFVMHPNVGFTTVQGVVMWGSGTNTQAINTAAQSAASITALNLYDLQVSGTSSLSANTSIDGVPSTTGTATGGTARAPASLTLTLGADDYDLAGRRGQGAYREVVVLDRALTAAERRTVQEYLARHWSVPITPAAPSGLTATVGDTTAALTWTAPSWNGGAALTGYTATAVPTDGTLSTVTCTSASTGCTLTGLTNGATYTVDVTATNSVGTGPASSTVTVIPYPATVMTSSATKLWLDGADPTTLLVGGCSGAVASTLVDCWKDRSGAGNNVTAPSNPQRPSLSATTSANGTRQVPLFDAGLMLYAASSTLPTGTSASTAFVVSELTDATPASSGDRGSLAWGGSSTGQLRGLYKPTGTNNVAATAYQTTGAVNGTWPIGSPLLTASQFSAGTYDLRTNGTPATTVTYAYNTTGSAVYVSNPSYPWKGRVDEAVVVNSTLSATARRQVEEYLARKWGVTITPSAPSAVTGNAGDTQATVTWSAPAWNGGSTITGYTVTASPGGATCTATFPTTQCTVTGLTNGTGYTFTVTATNAVGTGPASAASAQVIPPGPAGTPTAVTLTPGDAQLAAAWTAPGTGAPYTLYTATGTPTDNSLATRTCTATPPSTTCTLTGLTNGATYAVTVVATNATGPGTASTAVNGVPVPSLLSGANTKLWLDAQWASSLNSSTACTGSTVTTGSGVGCWKDRSASGWNAIAGPTNPVLTAAAINGKQALRFVKTNPDYLTVTGAGINTVGGADRSLFAVATARTTYGTAGTNSAGTLAAWPGWSGGLFAHANGGTTTVDTLQADGYTSGTSGMYAVTASTSPAMLASVYSSSGGTLTTSMALNGRGTLTSMSAAGSWITYANGLWLGSTSATASANYAYPLDGDLGEVIVLNRAVTPTERRVVEEYLARRWGLAIAPAAPSAATGTAGNASATVSWTAPAWDGGAALSSYTVTASPGGATCTATFPTTSCTVNGLTNGTAYTFTVTATNTAGTGPASGATGSVTPIAPPGAPTGVTLTAGDTTLAASWTAPASTGGSAITGYTATATPADGTLSTRTCTSATTSCTVTGLTNGARYSVTVTATNAAGTGSASTAAIGYPYPAGIFTSGLIRVWLDAADQGYNYANTGCTTAAGTTAGSAVACWKDKSGNGSNAVAVGGKNATVGSTMNSAPTLAFGNTTTQLSMTRPVTNDMTLLAAIRTTQSVGTAGSQWFAGAALFDAAGTTTGHDFGFTVLAGKPVYGTGNPDRTAVSTRAVTDGNAHVALGRRSGGNLSAAADGTTAGTNTSTWTGNADATTTAYLGIGANAVGYTGDYGELLVLSSALSTADQRALTEYLARKWGALITPQAPLSPSGVVASTTSVTVSWSAPAWTGGSAVTGYTVTASPGGLTCTTAGATSCTVSGLTHGIGYTFTVTATNTVGTGPASSATGTVTP